MQTSCEIYATLATLRLHTAAMRLTRKEQRRLR